MALGGLLLLAQEMLLSFIYLLKLKVCHRDICFYHDRAGILHNGEIIAATPEERAEKHDSGTKIQLMCLNEADITEDQIDNVVYEKPFLKLTSFRNLLSLHQEVPKAS